MMIRRSHWSPQPPATRDPGNRPAPPGQRPRNDRIAALLISDRAGGVNLETLMRVL